MFITNYLNFAFTKDKARVMGLQNRLLKAITILLFLVPTYLYIKKLQTMPIIVTITATLAMLLFILCILSLRIFLYQRRMHKEIYNEWYDAFGLPDNPKIQQKHKSADAKKEKRENNKNTKSNETNKGNKHSWGKKNNTIDDGAPEEIVDLIKDKQEQSRDNKKKPKLTRAERKEIADRVKEDNERKSIEKKNDRAAKKATKKEKSRDKNKSANSSGSIKPSKPVKPIRNKG